MEANKLSEGWERAYDPRAVGNAVRAHAGAPSGQTTAECLEVAVMMADQIFA